VESIISLKNVTKRYGGFLALDDVSVEIPPGIIGLLGPNGAGKSTLIKVLLGLVKLTVGDGMILGQQVAAENCFIEGIAGVEMVQFAAQLTGYPKLRSLQRAHEVLDFCGTGQERYRQVETYSTGMRQKLKFAQAIVHSPKLLILDEPTSGLDPEERVAMLNRIKLLGAESSMSVMICTHILKDVQDICEYAAVMVAGRVPLLQTVEKLRKPATPSFQIRVLGDPQPFMAEVVNRGATAVLGNHNVITVSNIDARGDRLIWECAKSVQISVQSVVPAKVSMEQVFMQVVQEATNGH
jgi:ABC-2 type transport system ATP-binding protein